MRCGSDRLIAIFDVPNNRGQRPHLESAGESVVVNRQARNTTGVDQDHILCVTKLANADQIDERGRGLATVNRVEDQALQSCQQANGVDGGGGWKSITLAAIAVCEFDGRVFYRSVPCNQIADDFQDARFQITQFFVIDVDPVDCHVNACAGETVDETRLGAGAGAGVHDVAGFDAHAVAIDDQFGRTSHVAQCAGSV